MTPKNENIIIGGETVKPGETKDINLFISKLFDFTDVYMPIKIIRGKEDGPRLFISSAIHGDEVNGVEIIRRLLKNKRLKKIKGTIIAVPIVNVFGFNDMSRYLPDRRDLNRCFPGTKKGSLAARLANVFVTEILNKCTHGIDLHTGSRHRSNLPQIRAYLKDAVVGQMANEFDVPVILNARLIDGSLRKIAHQKKIPLVVFEGGECLRYNEVAIKSGLSGVLSVMQFLGMIAQEQKKAKKVQSFIAHASYWERAPRGGVLIVKKGLGSIIEPGDLLGMVFDPLGNESIKILAQGQGVIIGQNQLPLVNQGDAVFHVATFNKIKPVTKSIEQFDDKFDYEEN